MQRNHLKKRVKKDETIVVAFEVNEVIKGNVKADKIVISVMKEEIPQIVKQLVYIDLLIFLTFLCSSYNLQQIGRIGM